jgi:hypothetical protein
MRIVFRPLAVVASLTLASASLLPAQTATPSPAETNTPRLNAPAAQQLLPWQKVGVRLSYYASASVTPGANASFQPMPNGSIINKRTGQTYGMKELRGSGGFGVNNVDIVGVEGDVNTGSLAISISSYLADGPNLDQFIPGTGSCGQVSKLAGDPDLFIRPEVLAGLKEGDDGGTRVARTQLQLSGRQINAISVVHQMEDGWTNHIYDLDSGILVIRSTMNAGEMTKTFNPVTMQPEDTGKGKTSSYTQLLGIRDLNIGKPVAVSPALRQGTVITMQGTTTLVSQMGPLSSPIGAAFRVEGAGTQSCLLSSKTLADANMNFWIDGNAWVLSNNATIGLAVNPARFQNVQAGAEIDRDAFTRTTVTFGGVQNGMLLIIERGTTWETVRGYDPKSGLMTWWRKTLNTQVGQTVDECRVGYQ